VATEQAAGAREYHLYVASTFLSAARGPQASMDWLQRGVGGPLNFSRAIYLYDAEAIDALWTWPPGPTDGEHSLVWLLRAAASMRDHGPASDRTRALRMHYAQENIDRYHMLGRMLLGLEKEETLLSFTPTSDAKCEVAFYLGLKAERDGRWVEAAEWYGVSVATQKENNAELRWARRALHRMTQARTL
jgi:hypothetical protein